MDFKVTSGNIDESIGIMREAASWLIERGQPLWKLEDLTRERLTETHLTDENFYVGWVDGKPAITMILQWHDPLFWTDVEPFESGFLHKLSVRREYAGTGLSARMLAHAEEKCLENGVAFLRIDCAGDRSKLRELYSEAGFAQIGRKKICDYDVALFEKRLRNDIPEAAEA